jgi:hypothetical protein
MCGIHSFEIRWGTLIVADQHLSTSVWISGNQCSRAYCRVLSTGFEVPFIARVFLLCIFAHLRGNEMAVRFISSSRISCFCLTPDTCHPTPKNEGAPSSPRPRWRLCGVRRPTHNSRRAAARSRRPSSFRQWSSPKRHVVPAGRVRFSGNR